MTTITANSKESLIRKIEKANIEYPVVADIQSGDIRDHTANAYYWAVVVDAIRRYMKDQGIDYSAEALHEFLKLQKYGKKIVQIGDIIHEVTARSRKFTKKQFSEFTQWAEAYAVDELKVPSEYFLREEYI